jgi:hypothetical protein
VPNTQSREVNLTKRVQTSKGPRFCPVVLSPNGRVKPDLVTALRNDYLTDAAIRLSWEIRTCSSQVLRGRVFRRH